MTGELNEERLAVRLFFQKDQILSEFYDLYTIEDHGSTREIEVAFTDEVKSSNVLMVLFNKDLRKAVLKEYKTAQQNHIKTFTYIKDSENRSEDLDSFIKSEIYKYHPGNFTNPFELCEKIKRDLKNDLIRSYERELKSNIPEEKIEYIRTTASAAQSIYRYFPIDELVKISEHENISKLSVDQLISLAAIIVEDSGNYKNSLILLEIGLLKDPDNWMLYNNRGLILDEMGLNPAAIFCYQKAFKLNPESDTALYNLGNSHYKLGHYEKALEYYLKSLEINPDKENSLNRIAACYLKLEDPEKSLHWAKLAFEKIKDEKNITNLAHAHALNNNFEEAFKLSEDLKSSEILYHNVRALIFYRSKEFQNAIDEIDKVYTRGALEYGIALIKFYCLVELNKENEAMLWLTEIEKRFPMNPWDYNNLGYSLMKKDEKNEQTTKLFRRAVDLDPNLLPAWNNLQANLGDLGQNELGLEACNEALKINPYDQKSIQNKMIFLTKLGRISEFMQLTLSKTFRIFGGEIDNEEIETIGNEAFEKVGIKDIKAFESLLKLMIELEKYK
jgi:tetratricopeptide (TPR) repeat protein